MRSSPITVSPITHILAADAQPVEAATGDGGGLRQDGGAEDSDCEPSILEEPGEAGDFELDGSDPLHEEYEEEEIKMGLSVPVKPSEEEIRQHNISHVPYRSWCRHCVRGKGRALMHRVVGRSAGDDKEVRPRVFMDYFYLSKREEGKETLPLQAILDENSQRTFSVSLPKKGLEHQYNAAVVSKLLRVLGHQRSVLKTDTERSLVALRNAVQQQLPNMSFEDAVKGESQTNGPIESAVGRLQAQARTLKSALGYNYEFSIPPRHPVLCWLVNYCGTLLSRFQKGADGRTPYERSTGKSWKIRLPEFGECVYYQLPKGERDRSKLEAKFDVGVYLGIQEGTGMRWIGTPNGVVRTWTTKSLPAGERWQTDVFEAFVGLPWQMRPPPEREAVQRPVPDMELEIELPGAEPAQPDVMRKKKGYIPRGIYIRRDVELQEFGYTAGCDGCEAAKGGLSHKQHSKACKKRISEEMAKTEEGRQKLERLREREEKYIVAYREAEEKKRALADGEHLKPVKVARGEREAEELFAAFDQSLPDASVAGGQGGLSSNNQSNVVAVPDVQDSEAVEPIVAEDEGVGERSGDLEASDDAPPPMDISSLHILGQRSERAFNEAVREASLHETADMLSNEEVECRRLLLQIGAVSRREAYDFDKASIIELFSPPRVTKHARERRLGDGVAMDLTTCDESGQAWNFDLADCRDKAEALIDALDPDLLIGSPPCGPYSQLQALNEGKVDPQVRAEKLKKAEEHLSFCCDQYAKRHARQKFFLHEHPALAASWKSAAVERIENLPGVLRVTGDMCEQGMHLTDEHGEGLAKKTTSYLTNSECIAEELSKRCSNDPNALGVWRQTSMTAKFGQMVHRGGPRWSAVQRRVTLDVSRGILLQDLRDVQSASKHEIKFPIYLQSVHRSKQSFTMSRMATAGIVTFRSWVERQNNVRCIQLV